MQRRVQLAGMTARGRVTCPALNSHARCRASAGLPPGPAGCSPCHTNRQGALSRVFKALDCPVLERSIPWHAQQDEYSRRRSLHILSEDRDRFPLHVLATLGKATVQRACKLIAAMAHL